MARILSFISFVFFAALFCMVWLYKLLILGFSLVFFFAPYGCVSHNTLAFAVYYVLYDVMGAGWTGVNKVVWA